LIELLFAQDEQDDNEEQSDAFQVSDTALEDEQQPVLDDDAENIEHIDLTDLEEPTIQDVDSYDVDTQEDLFGSISGTTTKDPTLRTKH
jgi:hypothetical protein